MPTGPNGGQAASHACRPQHPKPARTPFPAQRWPSCRPTPGNAVSDSRSCGITPPWSSATFLAIASRFRDFARKKPVDRISDSSSPWSAAERAHRIRKPAEQLRRHHVHAGVGALRRQDRGNQKLIRVSVKQGTCRLGIGRSSPLQTLRAWSLRSLSVCRARAIQLPSGNGEEQARPADCAR